MSYIDESYFINEISLPNLAKEVTVANLNSALDKYQKDALVSILGYELYDLMILDDSGQRFQNIINGASFTFSFEGKTIKRKWIGLANTELDSLIAYYTYYFYLKNKNTFTTEVGNVTPLNENSEHSTPILKMTTAYNRYIDMRGDAFKSMRYLSPWQRKNLDRYFKSQATYQFFNTDPSLYNFMLANLSSYPEWDFEIDRKINEFNI